MNGRTSRFASRFASRFTSKERGVSRWLRFGSIRARMTAAFALFVATLMTLMGVASALYLQNQARNRLDATLSQAMGELCEEIINDASHDENPTPKRSAVVRQNGQSRNLGRGDARRDERESGSVVGFVNRPSAELRQFGVSLLLLDGRGRVLAHSDARAAHYPLGANWRAISVPQEDYVLVVAAPWERVEAPLRQRLRDLLVFGGLAVVFSSLGAWFLVGRTLSPLAGLARQARSASADNLRLQLETPSSDAEMVGLVETLNDLLGRLAQTAAAQGRFYAAASHELRTPLHSLSALQEVALSRPREASELLAALRESHLQTDRLTRLVQDLLLLNQLETAATPPEIVCLDLADICEGELRDLAAFIAGKTLQIETRLPPICEFHAPWSHVKMLVRNLCENAVKYAVDGGRVSVEVSPCRVRIWNECEVPAAFDPNSQFEPFHRPDAARGAQTGGNGLGLSICRAICQTNGWNLTLKAQNGGVVALVDFGCGAPSQGL